MIDFLLGQWEWIAGALAAFVALWRARRAGVNKERRKAAERALEARRTADEVRDGIQNEDIDRVRDDLSKWMRDKRDQ